MPKRITNWKRLSLIAVVAMIALGGFSLFQQVRHKKLLGELWYLQDELSKVRGTGSNLKYPLPTMPETKEQLTEADLKKVPQIKECFTNSSLNKEENQVMQGIGVNPNKLEAASPGVITTFSWKKTPRVVDVQCRQLKLTDIKAGDMLNLYSSGGPWNLVGIQKL